MTHIGLKKIYSGKVRDLYEIDDKRMLMVASDPLSAFDVILDDPIPGKGEILTAISNFWFGKLAEVIFTPSTKAAVGDHDENISFEECRNIIGKELAEEVRDKAVRLYTEAAEYAKSRGIIICDTKFEFGLDENGTLTLMDEVLTPDSSRFWPADQYRVGTNPPSFDKQFVRDWLEQSGWNKQAPAPRVPADVIAKTVEKYREALTLLTR